MRNYVTNGCGAFTAFNEVIDYLKNNNYAVLVKDCPQFRAFLLKNDGVYTLKIHYLAKDYCSAYYEKQYEFGERLTVKKIAKIEALMDEAVDNYYEPKTEKVYVKKGNDFTEIEVPSFEGYETMVSTAKDVSAIVNGDEIDFEKINNCIETVDKVIEYYEASSFEAKKTFILMLNCLNRQLSNEYFDNANLLSAYKTKQKLGARHLRAPKWNRSAKLRTLLRDMERGVVYYSADSSYTYGYRYWHTLNPAEDIYEYNGRKFYMWDGWHSSLKVMKEVADRQFNA